jgi:fucose 4-O-acetylase-like acetyltransferase
LSALETQAVSSAGVHPHVQLRGTTAEKNAGDRQRTLRVEYAKAIGIILVVYGHVARGAEGAGLYLNEGQFRIVDSIIYSFHMPLFFFLSGLFFHRSLQKRGNAGFITNKIDTLLYPYLVWSVLQGSIEILLNNWTNNHATLTDVAEFLWNPRAQLWFLYALLVVSIFAVGMSAAAPRRFSGIVVLLACAAYLIKDHNLWIPPITYILTYYCFFVMGSYFETSSLGGVLLPPSKAASVTRPDSVYCGAVCLPLQPSNELHVRRYS